MLNLLTLVVLLSPLASPWALYQPEIASAAPLAEDKVPPTVQEPFYAWTDLFRAQVTLPNSTSRARLDTLGVVVLEESETRALILADGEQLETLARLRFQPEASDDLRMLLAWQGEVAPWLVESLQPLLAQAEEVRALGFDAEGSSITTESHMLLQARADLRTALQSLTGEQQAGIMSLISVDTDGDGLTDTEEYWWCTDPNNANSDGDANGYSDGQEVAALLDVTLPRNVRWGYGAPFGPPNAWPDFNGADGNPATPACNDGDYDTIPDYAEVYVVGLRVPAESTDGDKFDDGQEFFGMTYCPGAPTSCGHGTYPRIEYWSYIQASMPNWVEPPGDNPFVAAFPEPVVSVTPGSWYVERVTTITTEQGEIVQTEHSYATSATHGQGTSIADTVTWNEWEEVSEAVETPMDRDLLSPNAINNCTPVGSLKCRAFGGLRVIGGVAALGGAGMLCAGSGWALFAGCAVAGTAAIPLSKVVESGWKDLWAKDDLQANNPTTVYNVSTSSAKATASAEAQASAQVVNNIDFQNVG